MTRIILLLIILFSSLGATGQTKAEMFTRDSSKLVIELKLMTKADQQFRKNSRSFKKNAEVQIAIDEANTTRMLEIIQLYGFPSANRFHPSAEFAPHIIFVHAATKYFDTIRPLIEEEKAAGRMSAFEYAHVLWHLNGRKEFPVVEGATVKKKGKKTIIKL